MNPETERALAMAFYWFCAWDQSNPDVGWGTNVAPFLEYIDRMQLPRPDHHRLYYILRQHGMIQ